MFGTSIVDSAKAGTKAQLMALLRPWEDIQDTVLALEEGLIA